MDAPSPEDAPEVAALAHYLSERDVPCPGCRYNLRGLKLDVCPECGMTISLGLQGHMPGFRGWLGAVIMTSIGMGFSLLVLAGGTIELLMYGLFFDWIDYILIGSLACLVMAGVAQLTSLIRRRRKLWQRSERALFWPMVGGGLMIVLPIVVLMVVVHFA